MSADRLRARHRRARRAAAAGLMAVPLLGLGLFAILPLRPGATLYAALAGLSFSLGRWLLGAGHLVLPRAVRRPLRLEYRNHAEQAD